MDRCGAGVRRHLSRKTSTWFGWRRDATVWIGKGMVRLLCSNAAWVETLCNFSRLRWRVCLRFYYSIKASDFASLFNMCTSCFASSSYINPDLFQDKKIQRDLMSTWPLAAKPLESRWFGVEELPEAENLSKWEGSFIIWCLFFPWRQWNSITWFPGIELFLV